MEWTEGHVWVLKNVKLNVPFFQYKYVVLNNGQPERWELGLNRIADLALLKAEQPDQTDLILNDQFDTYTVNFSIHYPVDSNEHMRINGDPKQLGLWLQQGPVKMQLSDKDVVWLTGEKVRPWILPVVF